MVVHLNIITCTCIIESQQWPSVVSLIFVYASLEKLSQIKQTSSSHQDPKEYVNNETLGATAQMQFTDPKEEVDC